MKVYILIKHTPDRDYAAAVFDNESAAHESQEKLQQKALDAGIDMMFVVRVEHLRMNKLNAATIKELLNA